MNSLCHFCRHQTNLLFEANSRLLNKSPNLFTCTNCGFGTHGKLVRCGNCHIIYVDEKISQKQISTYYEVAEDPLYFAEQEARKKTFGGYLNRLEKIFPKKGKLLDVGTNTGLFVKLAKDSGWKAVGLEPNKWGVEYALKNYDIKLINKSFEKNVFSKDSFDVITMWDVIEHFTDPIEEINKVYWQLKSGGLFAFSTVDPDSLLAKLMGTNWPWFMEMHRTFLNPKAAGFYLQKEGFKKIIFYPHFRKLSLGYLSTRLMAINPYLAKLSNNLVKILGLSKIIVPYYANDLYDCYAFK